MKKTFLNYAMMAIAMMAMSVTMVSCGDDDATDPVTNSDNNKKPHTYILASIESNLYQYIDFTFKMDGKEIKMTVEEDEGEYEFVYTENKLNEGAKIEVTATLKAGVNVDAIADEYDFAVATEYITGTWDEKDASKIAITASYSGSKGAFSRLIENNKLGITTKQEAVEYVIGTIGKRLSGTVKSN